ncbi:MAG: transposase [Thermodesulfobacteriota bacterium]
MARDPDRLHRRSLRLGGYDYAQPGAYFVTVCTQDRHCLFGEIEDGEMRLNKVGQIVRDEWIQTGRLRPSVELDVFVVMPNHFHGILLLTVDGRGTARRAPTPEQFGKPVIGSLPTIIRSFKSATTKRINECRNTPGLSVWQRNYYEHVIREEDSLNRIRQYIQDNPARWMYDRENPTATDPEQENAWLGQCPKPGPTLRSFTP